MKTPEQEHGGRGNKRRNNTRKPDNLSIGLDTLEEALALIEVSRPKEKLALEKLGELQKIFRRESFWKNEGKTLRDELRPALETFITASLDRHFMKAAKTSNDLLQTYRKELDSKFVMVFISDMGAEDEEFNPHAALRRAQWAADKTSFNRVTLS